MEQGHRTRRVHVVRSELKKSYMEALMPFVAHVGAVAREERSVTFPPCGREWSYINVELPDEYFDKLTQETIRL
jgi:hypothetical protein